MKNLNLYLLLVALLISLFGCGGEPPTDQETAIRPVMYAQVTSQGGAIERSFNGTSQSGSETRLSFRANGLITQMKVTVGEKVRKNQLLAKLDQRDMMLNYEKAKASEESARIQLEISSSNLDRIKELYQVESASLSDYEQAKNALANAQNQYQSAQKTKELQSSQLSYGKIVAPTAGIVTQINAEVNEFAQAGSPIIIMNSAKGDIEINVGVPESYIARIQEGGEVMVKFPGIPDLKPLKGVITEVGFSNAGSASYPVTVKLSETNAEVRPGMPAEVNFRFDAPKGSSSHLVVDMKAVGEDEAGQFVYQLNLVEEGVFAVSKLHLKIGALTNEGFVVKEGLAEGDLVATAGLRALYEGRKVTLLDD